MTFALLILGGIAGALCRYHGSRLLQARLAHPFPLATFLINVSGSVALGLCYGFVGSQPTLRGQQFMLLFGTGFCGAYTTFSSFAFETVQLWRTHHPAQVFVNILAQPILGLLGAWLGLWLGARL